MKSGFLLNISLHSYLPPGREKPHIGGPENIDGVPIDKLPDIIEDPQETTEHSDKEEHDETKSDEKAETTTFKFDDFTERNNEGNSEEIGVEVTTEKDFDRPGESTVLPNDGGMYSGGNLFCSDGWVHLLMYQKW